jgi:hypothetical protein
MLVRHVWLKKPGVAKLNVNILCRDVAKRKQTTVRPVCPACAERAQAPSFIWPENSLQDVVQAKPRDADDHVAWLVQHGRHEKALEAVEKGGARQEVLEEVSEMCLLLGSFRGDGCC